MTFRAIAVVLLVTGLMACWLLSDRAEEASTIANTCNLMAQVCEWNHDGTHWQASMTHPIGAADRVLRLEVKGAASGQRLTGVVRGQSMFMGEYPVPMVRNESDDGWTAEFVPPFCSLESDMVWKIDFRQGPTLTPVENQSITLIFSTRSEAAIGTEQG